MTPQSRLASKLYSQWEAIETGQQQPEHCFVGFDGFTDEIVHAVQKRTHQEEFEPFQKISDFGQKIKDAAGKSTNIELVVQRKKLGGNAPIMTNALISGGHAITFAGAIGSPGKIEPIFQEMAASCHRVLALGPSAHSDAIEFEDGKIILGKLDSLKHINFHTLLAYIPRSELVDVLDESKLFVSANWTMLPNMNSLWEHLIGDVFPHFKRKDKRYLFVDLADPAKRSDEDIKRALELLKKMDETHHVILGLNDSEADRIENVLSGKTADFTDNKELIQSIHELSQLHQIVIHSTDKAMTICHEGLFEVKGPYCSKPKLTTGAGDNFNAGFCTALLYGLNPEECLLSGVSTSGYYVRRAESPTIPELAAFLHEWAENLNNKFE